MQPASYIPHTDEKRIGFYEREFYCLSNFSSFQVRIWGIDFQTSEHAYQWSRFNPHVDSDVRNQILRSKSAHEAYGTAQRYKAIAGYQKSNWQSIKCSVMLEIITAKANQHEYVRKKVAQAMQSGKILVEDSFRDSFWGHGLDGKGKNALGKLWMLYGQTLLIED